MAITNQDRVGKALELLREGLGPFVEREFVNVHRMRAHDIARSYFRSDSRLSTDGPINQWDAAALLSVMGYSWNDIFRQALGRPERSMASELVDWRNEWAHQGTDRSRARTLNAFSTPPHGSSQRSRRRRPMRCR